ncbi:uncharacterized protein LOC106182062 isoform X1 [Lingula anatina]|uniref:Uncharacterized protein LOC106182062 isoform X1 n=2 Tax=Lingula anatina TaxID=7574 RepID=A0A2R2MP60_LINAN|nr:uncharacterized protein LOC106182062 isoform X1 [Lingula anatina]|eukprot:XP_023932019.1 uncharacterized protein LOC106182062 isoform X1 [Lingula anatina]
MDQDLEDFMRGRGISDTQINKLLEEKMDKEVVTPAETENPSTMPIEMSPAQKSDIQDSQDFLDSPICFEGHYTDGEISFDIPVHSEMPILTEAENATAVVVDDDTMPQNEGPSVVSMAALNDATTEKSPYSVEMIVHMGTSSFFEVMSYFKDPEISDKLITITRILSNGEREIAEDTGGVLRDVLTEFWQTFYQMCTVGREVKVPALRHDLGETEWQAIGRVLLYGFKYTGYWPIKLSKAFLFSVICSNEEEVKSCLLEDFWKFVTKPDMEVLHQAYENYTQVDEDELLDCLETYECRAKPKEDNIRSVILEIAHTQLIQKPTFVGNCMRECLLDAKINPNKIEEIYSNVYPTSRRVIKSFKFPEFMDAMESEVAKHIKRYVKDADGDKLGQFLRYCTGSDLLTVPQISVEFSSLTGFQRRPVAHTCGCVLQLPRLYESYMDFRYEFDNILNQNIWVMDIV